MDIHQQSVTLIDRSKNKPCGLPISKQRLPKSVLDYIYSI
jgi:hypothetical protein